MNKADKKKLTAWENKSAKIDNLKAELLKSLRRFDLLDYVSPLLLLILKSNRNTNITKFTKDSNIFDNNEPEISYGEE